MGPALFIIRTPVFSELSSLQLHLELCSGLKFECRMNSHASFSDLTSGV